MSFSERYRWALNGRSSDRKSESIVSHTLTYQSRPWYGSSKKGEYRLHRDDTNSDENELYQSCRRRSCHAPVRFYKSFEFLGNGWEYSAFRNENWVDKIPAGIFPEVSDWVYLENSRSNYRMLVDHLGQEFVAESQFGDQCIQQQWLPNARPNRQRIIELSKRLLYLLANESWLPDVDLSLIQSLILKIFDLPKTAIRRSSTLLITTTYSD